MALVFLPWIQVAMRRMARLGKDERRLFALLNTSVCCVGYHLRLPQLVRLGNGCFWIENTRFVLVVLVIFCVADSVDWLVICNILICETSFC